MASNRILVLGATGTIGSRVAAKLLERGATVRVGARTPANAAHLAEQSAHVVPFDYDQPETWAAALADVDRVFVVAPFKPTFGEDVADLVGAAREAGVSHLVKLSAMGVSHDASFVLARQHAHGDDAVRNSGLGFTILQPTFFMDNLINFHKATIAGQGAFYGASAGGSTAYVSSDDIAEVAATVLTHPAAHQGQTYVITGGEALPDTEVATRIGAALGTEVAYRDIPGAQLAASLEAQGTPDWMVEALTALEAVKAAGWAASPTPVVQQVLGRAPESFDQFLARRAAAFRA